MVFRSKKIGLGKQVILRDGRKKHRFFARLCKDI